MTTPRSFDTPMAFKTALEQHLRNRYGSAFTRKRQLFIFDRFLARIAAGFGDLAVLKGGLALELRLERARTTKDVDLRLAGNPAAMLERLQEAGRAGMRDFMAFIVEEDPRRPAIVNDGMRYEGARYRVECRLGGKIYGQRFGLDVAFADPLLGEPDVIEADDVLDFAGVPPPRLRVYPLETHIAEKLHAYTLPHKHTNSRVKDLPDLALLGTLRAIEAARLRQALELTFDFRHTHDLPAALPSPPGHWAAAYEEMASRDALPWEGLQQVFGAARSFLDPVLENRVGTWNLEAWEWKPGTVG